MSRIGKKPISIPKGVDVTIESGNVNVTGKLGKLNYCLLPGISIDINDNIINVNRENDQPTQRSYHGLTRALIQNMVVGVSEGYAKILEINGTGYTAEIINTWLRLALGYSHDIILEIPKHLTVETEAVPRAKSGKTNLQAIVTVRGISKEDVGKFAAEIRRCRPPENYKGKGIRYRGEEVKIKAGKAGAKK